MQAPPPRFLALRALLALACFAPLACSPASSARANERAGARVVCLGSAVAEIAFAIGAGDQIVAVDESCEQPAAARALPQLAFYRRIQPESVLAHAPTLVLAHADSAPLTALDQLRAAGLRIELISGEAGRSAALARVRRVGELLGATSQAEALATSLEQDYAQLEAFTRGLEQRPRVLCLYGRGANQISVAGRGTAAHAMIELTGGTNVGAEHEGYKPISAEGLAQCAPDHLVLPQSVLESAGGLDAIFALPGMQATPAGRARSASAHEDQKLFNFGPRSAQAAWELARALHGEAASAR
jgi:iron complex transport system substrate-binding protein